MANLPVTLLIYKLLFFFSQTTAANDNITQFHPLPDSKTMVSKNQSFELGFFSPGNSTNRYVGIWYSNISERTVVWVANRDNPIKDNSSMLIINVEGNLVLLSQNKTPLWSTNTSTKALSPIVQLLDTGNLVLRDEKDNNNEDSFLWQSFNYPTDTLLPGMKLGWDRKTGLNRRVIAWKNWDDPSSGNFIWAIERGADPQMVMWKGSVVYHRIGPWNGVRFSGTVGDESNSAYLYKFINNEDEVSYTYHHKNKSMIVRVIMNQTEHLRRRFIWMPEIRTWLDKLPIPIDKCDIYNPCGPFGYCVGGDVPACQCLEGFKQKSSNDWTQGCVRREPWSCRVKNSDGFRRFAGMKIPDTTYSWVNNNLTLDDCKAKCLENCSCTAYSILNVTGAGSGCIIWFGDLIDMRPNSTNGQDLHIRMAALETGDAKHGEKKKMILVGSVVSLVVLVLLFAFFYLYRSKTKYKENKDGGGQEDLELPIFDLDTIVNATNDFSVDNKLGEGGFGPVYKGTLRDGQEIAVKRLSRSSRQGLKEFKNEVILCAKLQHRNLVKVLGCCIQGEEKMLIYEYMPNKSLDSFLFNQAHSPLLDWSKRFNILCGIARGLLYLHQDSRLRIIHRDLKASNILLDNNMNPKISDFGLARMCGGDQIEGNTSMVVGTYGYMAPEYAIDGLFSVKSDVFSFGVLLLEIITGKKNRGVSYPGHSQNLIEHAWRLWKESIPMELIDECRQDSCVPPEALRCIHIALLCVQQNPVDRPDMLSVMMMLNSEKILPQPMEPGFLIQKVSIEGEYSGKETSSSMNDVTISVLEAR